MIKIIKNTMIDPISIQCEYCQSELEYNFEDIQRSEVPALFSFTATTEKRYIICPVCKREIALKDRIVIGSEAADD